MITPTLLALAAKTGHVQQANAGTGTVTFSVALVAGLLGWWLSVSGRHWVLSAVCWITVGASGLAFAGTVAGLVSSVITGIGHAFSGAAG